MNTVTSTQEIPLFPLKTVLFPGMTLPLHIFEPRYQLMIGECIKASQPFGVVRIRAGSEVDDKQVQICEVGTTAFITQVERLDGGLMNIATLGCNRFKVMSVHNTRPFLSGIIQEFPLQDTEHPQVALLAGQLEPKLRRYLNIFATLAKVQFEVETLPKDPTTLAFLTAIVLRTPMEDKQTLLNVPDLLTLLRLENKFLWREAEILKVMIEHGPKWRDNPQPFSAN